MNFGKLLCLAVLLPSTLLGSHAVSNPTIPYEKLPALEKYIETHREGWLNEDLPVLENTPRWDGELGWTLKQSSSDGLPLKIYRKKFAGNKDNTYYYWDDLALEIPLNVTIKLYSSWIDLAENFLKSIKVSKKLHTTANGEDLWFQYIDTGIPLSAARTITSVCVKKNLTGEIIRRTLISCRSIPVDLTTIFVKGAYPIHWRAAYLLTEDRDRTLVRKIDQENEGGLVTPTILDLAMPKYLNEEVLNTLEYVSSHRSQLIDRASN